MLKNPAVPQCGATLAEQPAAQIRLGQLPRGGRRAFAAPVAAWARRRCSSSSSSPASGARSPPRPTAWCRARACCSRPWASARRSSARSCRTSRDRPTSEIDGGQRAGPRLSQCGHHLLVPQTCQDKTTVRTVLRHASNMSTVGSAGWGCGRAARERSARHVYEALSTLPDVTGPCVRSWCPAQVR